jgi:hypothetical protein
LAKYRGEQDKISLLWNLVSRTQVLDLTAASHLEKAFSGCESRVIKMNGAINGRTSATHAASKESWRNPAAWRSTVRKGRIAVWHVYADNKPVYELLSEHA